MFKRQLIAAIFLGIGMQSAGADEIALEWTYDGGSTPDYTFRLDLQATDVAGTATLNGYMQYSSGDREATLGSATYSPNEDVYAVSLFFNSSTGESFTIGANLDPTTLSGAGDLVRVAHGGVAADAPGTLAVVPLE
jgi:hypothetical protein